MSDKNQRTVGTSPPPAAKGEGSRTRKGKRDRSIAFPPLWALGGLTLLALLLFFWLYFHFYPWYSQIVGERKGFISSALIVALFVFGLLRGLIGTDEARNRIRRLLKRLERARGGLLTVAALNILA